MCDVVSQLFTSLFCLLSMMIICGGYHSILFLNVSLITLLFRIILNREKTYVLKTYVFEGNFSRMVGDVGNKKMCVLVWVFKTCALFPVWNGEKNLKASSQVVNFCNESVCQTFGVFGFHNISQSLSNITAICWI